MACQMLLKIRKAAVKIMKINLIYRLSNTNRMIHNQHYKSANEGDLKSAFLLIDEMVTDFSAFRKLSCFVCPVQKKSGNKIPLALASRIVENSAAILCDSVFLMNNRPGNKMIDRMFFEPEYSGRVPVGKYILVDDVFTTGITLKGLKTFIESNGGDVISAYTLGSSKTLLFEASKLKLKMLKAQFPEIEKYFDLHKLTIAQIEYLQRFSSLSNLHNLYSRNQFEKQFY